MNIEKQIYGKIILEMEICSLTFCFCFLTLKTKLHLGHLNTYRITKGKAPQNDTNY